MVVAEVGLGLVQPPGVEAGVLQGVAGVAEAGEVVPRHVAARHARVGPVREPVEPVLRRRRLHSQSQLIRYINDGWVCTKLTFETKEDSVLLAAYLF